MDKKISFEHVPELLGKLNEKIDYIIENQGNKEPEQTDFLMTLPELQEYLPDKPARQTVYGWVNARKIPYEKHGKTLYFRKSKIDNWLRNGRKI